MSAVRVGVLVSGTGTILEALVEEDLPLAVVVADRPCRALQVASHAGVPGVLVDRRDFGGFGPHFDRAAFSRQVTRVLQQHHVEVVAMAGFGTVLAEAIHDAYRGRILNTHPALLPAFPGWHAVEDALAAGVAVTGCTVHVATLDVDAGPILAQREVPVLPDDTAGSLHERIKAVERRLYPLAIRQVLDELARDGEAAPGSTASSTAGSADGGRRGS